jgi:putative redox protein
MSDEVGGPDDRSTAAASRGVPGNAAGRRGLPILGIVKPPTTATLIWQGDLRFAARSGTTEIVLDSDGTAGPSPVQALAMALAGCMAIDVADIVSKGRHSFTALEATVVGQRQDDPPRRFLGFTMHFIVTGGVPDHAVERAIQLSREKYCSVWHSLRQDLPFETSFEVRR